jgi:hypothetical protein
MSIEKEQTRQLKVKMKSLLEKYPRTPIILVTHHVNILAMIGKNINQGDMVVLKVNKNGEPISHTLYPNPIP